MSEASAGRPVRTVDDSGPSRAASGYEKRHLLRQSSSVQLPDAGVLVHSYSQPELYYQSISPARLAQVDALPMPSDDRRHGEHYSRTMRIDEDTDTSFDTTRDFDQPTDEHHHHHHHPHHGQQDDAHAKLGPSTYQFDPGRGEVTTSPTMQQHAETHQTWIHELREEQRREAEIQEAIAGRDTEGETTDAEDPIGPEKPLMRMTSSPDHLKGKVLPRPRSTTTDEDDSDTSSDADELPELTVLEVIALCLPAAAVMIGWAVGEALLLPYLLSLGVAPTIANFAFLINPLFGLFLQPFFGRLSDQCTLEMGRRRPFLLLFSLGSATGLTTVVWSKELTHLLSGGQLGEGSLLHIIVIFIGFACMDLCHDLLLMPARSLLNDRLPDEQTDQGNAYFASISSIGTCIGLTLTIVPLEEWFPWSMLEEPVRATFTTATFLILACNLTTIAMSAEMDRPFSDTDLDQIEGAGEESDTDSDSDEEPTSDRRPAAQETSRLLPNRTRSYGSGRHLQQSSPSLLPATPPLEFQREILRVAEAPDSEDLDPKDEADLEKLAARSARWCLCFAENPLTGIVDAYNILPRPLKFIWLLQLIWWYCVLHVNLWWTSWMAVELYGGPAPAEAQHAHGKHHHQQDEGAIDADEAVRLATIGLLTQAVISFPSSAALPFFNRLFGITNWYHYSAILYGLAVLAIGFVNAYYQTIIIMVVLGVAIPPIFSSSYILVEVYAAEADLVYNEDSDDDEEDDATSQPGTGNGNTPRVTPRFGPASIGSSPQPLEGQPNSLKRKPSDLKLGARAGSTSPLSQSRSSPNSSSPLSATRRSSSSRSKRSGSTTGGTLTESDESEFTTATLEDKRGTITALFNITMIVAQLVIGLCSGFMIDYFGNITIVFYLSGALLVVLNFVVVFFRLSKPDFHVPEEEGEEEEDVIEAKIQETVRQQHEKKFQQLERHPSMVRSIVSPAPPHTSEFESIPHIAVPPPQGGHYVRPLGEEAPHRPSHHAHIRHRPLTLKRSLSAPDVHLATRFLRRSRAAKLPPKPKQLALFQPHRMTLGMRRDLLRGARPRMKNVREMDSDAGSVESSRQKEETRQKMREAHNKRIEAERVEQLRERVRLFGIKVATRAAQIKATRAKMKHHRGPSMRGMIDPVTGLPTSASKRNNSAKRKSGTHTQGASLTTTPSASSDAPSSAQRPAASDLDESKGYDDPSNFFADNATASRVHWSILTDPPTEASLIPLPTPGSQQEADLIQHLAEKSIEREQRQLASAGLDDSQDIPPLVHLPIVLPDDSKEPLLALPVTPSVVDTPKHRDTLAHDL